MDVSGKKCLELGAGSGLVSIISAMKGARLIVASDYPSPYILSALEKNLKTNIPNHCWSVIGHAWGTTPLRFNYIMVETMGSSMI